MRYLIAAKPGTLCSEIPAWRLHDRIPLAGEYLLTVRRPLQSLVSGDQLISQGYTSLGTRRGSPAPSYAHPGYRESSPV